MNMTIKISMAGLFIMVALLVPVAAVLPSCPPGEVWGQTGQNCYQVPTVYGQCQVCPSHEVCDHTSHQYGYYTGQPQVWHVAQNGHCPPGQSCSWQDICTQSHTVYDCHSEGYISCDGQHHEKEIITPTHEQCDPIFGCIATTCPAIPCDEGYSCIEGQCIQDQPECTNNMGFRASVPSGLITPYDLGSTPATVDFWSNPYPNIEDPFPEGTTYLWDFGDGITSTDGPSAVYHTYTIPGIYDVTLTVTFPSGCPGSITETKRAYLQVVETEAISTSSFSPYTEPACQAILNNLRPMDNIDPSTLPVLNLKNTYVSAAFKYASQFDCVYLAYYTRGESSFSRDCTAVEHYNREQTQVHAYGGMPILTALNPAGAICIGAVKNSPTENTLPVTITLTDSHGTVGNTIISPNPVIIQCYQLPEDFSECRHR